MKLFLNSIVVVAAFLASAHGVCVPSAVKNFKLTQDYFLQWDLSNICGLQAYTIHITDLDENLEYEYFVNSTTNQLSVGHLEICKTYTFDIQPVTNESLLGPGTLFNTTVPPSSEIDLALVNITAATSNNTQQVNISWSLANAYVERCISYYRVIYWDQFDEPSDSYVTSNNFILQDFVPCSNYTVEVNAIVGDDYNMEGPTIRRSLVAPAKEPSVPSITSLTTTSSSVSMVWKLEPYAQNECQLVALNVYTLGVPLNMSYIKKPINDNVLRTNVNFTLEGLTKDSVFISYINLENNAGTSKNVTVTYQTKE
ncbi:hypothetical protein ABEB36_001142 [Hypothenemus hampei]|uniref:Fibronectin type-III domain-containing protein n=1 Tax=Hypothenemus hampei TaxID=57062 RepID=A0ABD1FDP3_HYPHA